jgi:hypothetical protein
MTSIKENMELIKSTEKELEDLKSYKCGWASSQSPVWFESRGNNIFIYFLTSQSYSLKRNQGIRF